MFLYRIVNLTEKYWLLHYTIYDIRYTIRLKRVEAFQSTRLYLSFLIDGKNSLG